MNLPFTRPQFFEAFASYNEDVMPLQVALVVRRPDSDRVISAILAGLWAWMAIVYHLLYFREINPAATLFGAAFLAAAAIFAWTGVVRRRLVFDCESRARRITGHALIAYALVGYPLLSAMLGREFPEMPTFGLPCPTTIFTLGMLAFLSAPFPRYAFAIPIAWSLIGAQAAFLLGVYEDLGLLAAGLAGVWLAFDPPAKVKRA
ncbi:MAG: DUF6064 family protein [Burkholderiales bacterium]